jgi:hypothetical protein
MEAHCKTILVSKQLSDFDNEGKQLAFVYQGQTAFVYLLFI